MQDNFAKILGKCRENLGKMVKCKILVKRLGLGISWESLEKMLVNCRPNVGKIFGKYQENVEQMYDVGKMQEKLCKMLSKCQEKLAKYWETISKMLNNCNCKENVGKILKTPSCIMFIEPLSFMYQKISLISINPNEAVLFIQTFILAFNSLYLYRDIQ